MRLICLALAQLALLPAAALAEDFGAGGSAFDGSPRGAPSGRSSYAGQVVDPRYSADPGYAAGGRGPGHGPGYPVGGQAPVYPGGTQRLGQFQGQGQGYGQGYGGGQWGGGCYGCSYNGDYQGGGAAVRRLAPPQRFQGQRRNGQWYY
jgi:hypothetical protein